MTAERTINLVIVGILLFGLAALCTGAWLALHRLESAAFVNLASVALGGLVGVLASTRSKPTDPPGGNG